MGQVNPHVRRKGVGHSASQMLPGRWLGGCQSGRIHWLWSQYGFQQADKDACWFRLVLIKEYWLKTVYFASGFAPSLIFWVGNSWFLRRVWTVPIKYPKNFFAGPMWNFLENWGTMVQPFTKFYRKYIHLDTRIKDMFSIQHFLVYQIEKIIYNICYRTSQLLQHHGYFIRWLQQDNIKIC